MSTTLTLKVVSPQGTLLETEANSVQFPGEDGLFGVLPRHAAMTSLTASGVLRAKTPQGEIEYVIHDGFAQVRDNVVTILTRSAEQLSELDLERAQSAVQRARDRIKNNPIDMDMARAQMALRRALLRERLARRR